MYRNPVYPTSYPWGLFYLYQNGPADDVHISGFMHSMPQAPAKHGFAINPRRVNWRDKESCDRNRDHFNPTGENHGQMDGSPSHVGDLWPVITDSFGSAYYYQHPNRPTFYGPNHIYRRSMTIYEKPDDFGTQDTDESMMWGSSGRPIACCNIQGYRIWRPYPWY